MIRFACPKCAKTLSVQDNLAGAAVACRSCGQKFRVPGLPVGGSVKLAAGDAAPRSQAPPKRTAPQPKGPTDAPPDRKAAARRRPDEPEEEEVYEAVYVEDEEPAPPPRPSKRPPKVEADDEADDADREPEPEEEQEERPRKKKKKRKKKQQGGLTAMHVALVVFALLVVGGITGLVYFIQKGGLSRSEPPPDPAEVLAELQKVGASIGYDNSPEKNVISVGLTGCDFPAALLDKLVAFPKLARLDLGQTTTSDVKLEHLRKVTTLKTLNLGHTKVTGGGLQFLSQMTELEDLSLSSTLVTDAGLEHLKGCTKLKRLNIDGTLASGLGLKAVIPGLEINR